ncbi:MAG: amino acid ABC transporter substrate-binding protein [Gemmatimonadetes bacterium]|nr:amino acid ABC transporter substrate-binding protein [Gemmatimonadota bacterium]
MSGIRPAIPALSCLLGLALGGCDESLGPPLDPGPIVIAAAYSETGRHAHLAGEMARGYRLGVEMLNERGGIDGREVRLVLRDDASDAETSAGIYREFIAADTIHALLGPYTSPITDAVVTVTEAAGWPLIAPMAAAPEIWAGQGRSWSVQMLNPGPTYLQGSVEVAAQLGAGTVALIYEDTQFPASVAEGVREAARVHGLDIVMDQSYAVGQADHEALATAARDAGGDLFIGGGYYADAVELTKAVDAVGYEPLVVSLNLGPAEPDFIDDVGDLARCVAGNSPWLSTIRTSGSIADSETFVERFVAAHGLLPGYHPAGGFGAVELLASAMETALAATGTLDPAAIRDHLFSVSTETVLGPFAVFPLGDDQAGAQRALAGLQVQWQDDGQGGLALRIIHPASVADAEPCAR